MRSEVGDSTLAVSDTPCAKPANPFRSGSDCTPFRTPERPAAAQKQGTTASPFIWRAEAEIFTPRAFSTPREKSGNPFRIENDLWPLAKSSACVESLRLLDSNNSFRRAGSKVRAMETERTQLQMQVDRLRLQIEQQQQQLEAQENIIKQLNEFVVKQEKPQGTQTGKNRVPQGFARRGWECWICGDRGHLRRKCPKWRENQSDQSSGNLNRASSRAQ